MTHSNQEAQKTLRQIFVQCKPVSVHNVQWSCPGWRWASGWPLHTVFCLWNPGKRPFWRFLHFSISTDLSSRVMVNCLWKEMWIPSTLLVCPCKCPGDMWHDIGEVTSQCWVLTLAPLRHDEGRIFSHKQRTSTPWSLLSFPCHPARCSRRQHCLQLHKHTPSKTWKPHAGTAHRQRSCSCN